MHLIVAKINKPDLLHEDMFYGEKSLSFEGESVYNIMVLWGKFVYYLLRYCFFELLKSYLPISRGSVF